MSWGYKNFFFTITECICIKKLILWDQIFKQIKYFIVISLCWYVFIVKKNRNKEYNIYLVTNTWSKSFEKLFFIISQVQYHPSSQLIPGAFSQPSRNSNHEMIGPFFEVCPTLNLAIHGIIQNHIYFFGCIIIHDKNTRLDMGRSQGPQNFIS